MNQEGTFDESALPRADVAPVAYRFQRFRVMSRLLASDLLLAAGAALFYAAAVFLQEKILRNDGLGDDGWLYGKWTQDFLGYFSKSVSRYQVQRALPSAVAYLGFRLLSWTPSHSQIVFAFELINIALVFGAAYAWCKIARRLDLSQIGKIFGACVLFGSFGIAKWTAYYPVLGDMWGFAFGLFLLCFYLANRPVLLTFTAVVGAFAWPTILPAAVPLLLFGQQGKVTAEPDGRAGGPRWVVLALAALPALAWAVLCQRLHADRLHPGSAYGQSIAEVDQPIYEVVRLSIALAALFIFLYIRRLIDARPLYRFSFYRQSLLRPRSLLALLAVLVVHGTVWLVGEGGGVTVFGTLNAFTFTSTAKPAISLLAHVLFFGPIVIVMALRWRQVCALFHRQGMGLTLTALLALTVAIGSESRQSFTFAAIILPFGIKLVDDLRLPRPTLLALAAVSLFYSKLWLTIDGGLRGKPQEFPTQSLFMTNGPWMSPMMYLIQSACVVVTALWIKQQLDERALRAP